MRQAVYFSRLSPLLAPNPIIVVIPSLEKYGSSFVKAVQLNMSLGSVSRLLVFGEEPLN